MTKNLKLLLLDVQNQLIQQENWIPGTPQSIHFQTVAQPKTTQPLVDLINFLNENPLVQTLLLKHGLEWNSAVSSVDLDDAFEGEVLTPPSCRLNDPGCDSCQ